MISNSRSVSRAVSEVVGSSKMISPRLPRQGLGDLDKLAFALRQPHDRRDGRDLEIDKVERLLRLLSEGPAVDEREAIHSSWKMIEEDVLLDAEIGKETELLVNEAMPSASASREVAGATSSPARFDAPAVPGQHAAEDIHRRRLA